MIELLAFTTDAIGKVMVSYTVLQVHFRMWQEHRIDKKVYDEMREERYIGLFGIFLMLVGYFLHLFRLLFGY